MENNLLKLRHKASGIVCSGAIISRFVKTRSLVYGEREDFVEYFCFWNEKAKKWDAVRLDEFEPADRA